MAAVKGLSFTIGKNENAVAVDFANFNSSATTAADLKKDMQAYIAKAVTDAGKANVYDVSGNGSKIKIEAAPATAAAAADLNTGYNITVSTVSNVKLDPTTGAVVSGGNSGGLHRRRRVEAADPANRRHQR